MTGSGLSQRAATAAFLIPLWVGLVLWLPTPLFALSAAVVVLLGAWEWAGLAGVATPNARLSYQLLLAGLMLALWLAPSGGWLVWVFLAIALWWWWLAFRLPRIRVVGAARGGALGELGAGIVVLLGPWLAVVHLHALPSYGPMLVLFLLGLIWIADSAAYFSGRRWGRAPLAPVLSPGKTWAGAYGALIGAALWGLVLVWGLGLGWGLAAAALLICSLSVAMSIVGDLYESLLKRRRGLKDSGQLLPGHGGMLDRIDSLTAAAPIFALGMSLLGVGE